MTGVADGIAIRATGIAGATLTSADLSRARVFYLARLGFPLLFDGTDHFVFGIGDSAITVRSPPATSAAAERPAVHRLGLGGIVLWCAGDELRAVAEALTAAGIAHSGVTTNPQTATEHVAFDDPDGVAWELRAR